MVERGEKKYQLKCCVPGCDYKFSKKHRFPKDVELLQRWLNSVAAAHLQSMSKDKLLCVQ